jgi:hypothetical protein
MLAGMWRGWQVKAMTTFEKKTESQERLSEQIALQKRYSDRARMNPCTKANMTLQLRLFVLVHADIDFDALQECLIRP